MRSLRLSFLCSTALSFLMTAPVLRAASFERFHGDSSHVESGGWSTAARTCPSGGFLTTGTTTTGQVAVHAVRTAEDGATLWEKNYTFGPGITGGGVVELRDGSGFVVAGSLLAGPGNEADVYLMKVDCAGTPVWAHAYPGPGGFLNAVDRLIEAANGDLVVAGLSQSSGLPISVDALLLRVEATGALRWSRRYDGGDFTLFQGVAEARTGQTGRGDLVVVGYRQDGGAPQRPIVLRLAADGTAGGPLGCALQYEPAAVALFSSVIELTSPGLAGSFVLAGRIEGTGALLVRTEADVCRPVIERLVAGDTTGATEVVEVTAPLPGVPAGTLAVAGTVRDAQAPDDGYLMTVSASGLKLRSAHVIGDHAPANIDSRFAIVRSVLPLSDGFAVTGDTTIGPIFGDDMDLYVVKTDAQGETPCDVPWSPAHGRISVPTTPLTLPSAVAGLGSVPQTHIVVEDTDAGRDACE
jgi:hypothetical protein